MFNKEDKAAYLKAFGVPTLLDSVMGSILSNPPQTTYDFISALHRAIDDQSTKMHVEAARCYSQAIRDLHDGIGISAQNPLFFCALSTAGQLMELFPHGSRVRVTPFNVDHFMHCTQAKQSGNSCVPYLPLAQTQSLGGSYGPILDLIESVVSGTVPELRMTAAEWNAHRVTYCVPNQGVIVDLVPSGSNMPVHFDDIRGFVAAARSKLRDLQSGSRTSQGTAPSAQKIAAPTFSQAATIGTVPAPSPPTHPQESSPSRPFTTPSHNAPAPAAAPAPVAAAAPVDPSNRPRYEMLPVILDELGRANTPQGDPLSREEFDMLDVYYCVPIAGKIVPLIENGHKIRVKFEEKDKYVALAKARLGLDKGSRSVSSPEDNKPLAVKAREQGQGSGDGLLSPKKYEFELFRNQSDDNNDDNAPASPTGPRQLSAAEVDYHFRTLIRQLSVGNWTTADVESLNLYFVGPKNGVFIDLMPGGAKEAVTAERKDEFILRAQKFLMDLDKEAAPPIQLDAQPRNIPKKGDEDQTEQLFSPTHWEGDLFAPYTTTTDLEAGGQQQKQAAAAAPDADAPTAEETKFWEMIDLLDSGAAPLNVEDMNLRFVLKFPNDRLLPLRVNGSSKKVTQENLSEFISLVREKKDLVHMAFVFSQSNLNDEEDHSRYAPADAPTWNKHDLTEKELSNPIFSLVENLKALNEADFQQVQVTYCIPIGKDKKFDLIPNGHNINVSFTNRSDFISRVEFEKRRLERKHRQAQGLGGSNTTYPAGQNLNGSSTNFQVQASSSLRDTKAASFRMRASINHAPLTSKQTNDLRKFKEYIELLSKTECTDGEWEDLKLVFSLKTDNLTIDLLPNGSKIHVTHSRKKEYVDLTMAKIAEMLNDEETRDKAVQELPQQGDPDQMGLFSPSHFDQDLFAPAQEITTHK